jgi:hypothetical protein
VENSINTWISKNGYLLYVHPSLWRQAEHPLQELMKKKQIICLEIHDEKDGQRVFRCSTRYDWYLLQNKKCKFKTKIKTQDNKIIDIDLTKWNFIPNMIFNEIEKLVKLKNKVNILHNRSAYGTDKKWMNKIKTNEFKYPCIYSINKKNEPSFKWSNTNKNGMFAISKVIWGSGATGFIIDSDGKYGITEWASGIADTKENLENIKKCFESKKFKQIINATSVSKAEINIKILKYFNKDFWKEFI